MKRLTQIGLVTLLTISISCDRFDHNHITVGVEGIGLEPDSLAAAHEALLHQLGMSCVRPHLSRADGVRFSGTLLLWGNCWGEGPVHSEYAITADSIFVSSDMISGAWSEPSEFKEFRRVVIGYYEATYGAQAVTCVDHGSLEDCPQFADPTREPPRAPDLLILADTWDADSAWADSVWEAMPEGSSFLRLVASPSKAVFDQNEPLLVSVALVNAADTIIRVYPSFKFGAYLNAYVVDPHGDTLQIGGHLQTHPREARHISPGREIREIVDLRCCLVSGDDCYQPYDLSAGGAYTITIVFIDPLYKFRPVSATPFTVTIR